jgi:hypothetical protein
MIKANKFSPQIERALRELIIKSQGKAYQSTDEKTSLEDNIVINNKKGAFSPK